MAAASYHNEITAEGGFQLVTKPPLRDGSHLMSHLADATAMLASDRFWRDSQPVAIVEGGARPTDLKSIPDNHLLFATSGTSSKPKWVALSKKAALVSAYAVNHHLDVSAQSVWGLALPIHHVGGFSVIARSFSKNCDLQVFKKSWDPNGFTRWISQHSITHTSLVPTQVHDLVTAGCRAPASLRVVVVGGGRLESATGAAARALGWPVLASYGMTEAASQVATQSIAALGEPYRPWPLPVLPHWAVRNDAEGCLEISGPALFSGIVTDGFYQPRKNAWHATRDRVSLTPGGLLPHGRADALVKIAGELVDPNEITSRLCAAMRGHEGGIVVTALDDERLGQRLVIVAEPQVPAQALADAIAAYDATAPRSQRLGNPKIIEKLPRGVLGKIQIHHLREWLANQ